MDYTLNPSNDATNIHDHLTNARSWRLNDGHDVVKKVF